ncbi:MAG: DHA2 family efflux MFS transporter permease subunit, partial [Spirochaetales bacterium]|nr:DHA2 family efflux MFS transporter permease subunit [Spirochaetales bacterium]
MSNPFRHKAVSKIASFHHEHPSYRWWVLGNVLISTFMAVIESTVVNTAIPKMQAAFGTSLDIIEWVLTAFNLTFAVILPLSGWLADKIGYKRIFFLALALFTTGSFLCSLAWNETILIVFRVIQAAGGGMLQPVGMAIVLREFPPKQRGLALGFYGIAAAASISIGPSLGGFLADTFGWQSIFLINVPFGTLAMIATVLIQREYKNPKVGAFDFWGFITSAIFLVSLLLALADGNAGWNTGGWTSPFIITCFGIAAVSLAIFLLVEFRVEHPMMNLRLLGERNFGLSNLLIFFIGLVLMGSAFLFPVYLQGSLGYTAFQAGLIFLPMGFLQGFISPI